MKDSFALSDDTIVLLSSIAAFGLALACFVVVVW